MSVAVSVPVSGGLPPIPQGATLNERGTTPAPVAAVAVPEPTPVAPVAPVAAPVAPAVNPDIAALLAALQANQPTAPVAPAQPPAAPAPAQPVVAAVAGQDPVLTSFSEVLSTSGVDVQRAVGRALEDGDASLIDFAYLAEAGGANVKQLETIAKAMVAHQEANDARIEQSVYAKFGGESVWDAALTYFAQNSNEATKEYVVSMLKTRNPQLIEQATNMIRDTVMQAGAMLSPAVTVHGAGGQGGLAPLDKDGFKQEIAKLRPGTPGFEQARQELFVRRSIGKQQGR